MGASGWVAIIGAVLVAAVGGGQLGSLFRSWLDRPKIAAEAREAESGALATLDPIITGWLERMKHEAEDARRELAEVRSAARRDLDELRSEVQALRDELRVERARRRAFEAVLIEHRIAIPTIPEVPEPLESSEPPESGDPR